MAAQIEDSIYKRGSRIGILVGGGPAPGINGVISAITLEARTRAHKVIGIYDGFQWLMRGDIAHTKELNHSDVSRVHFHGGSILNTSRANPTKNEKDLERVVASLRRLDIGYLATIGGDDTMFAASQVAKFAKGSIRVCHVPKTIDNDLPLPGETPTFGFETARQLGSELVHNLMEDSRTTGRWYFVVVMGRSAGHLALGIGKATGATLTLIPEEFAGPVSLTTVCDILEGAILKRKALWNRDDGVAVIAEGLLEHMPAEELKSIDGVRITHDQLRPLAPRRGRSRLYPKDPDRTSLRQSRRDSSRSFIRISAMSCARRRPSLSTANMSAPSAMARLSSCSTQAQQPQSSMVRWFAWSMASSTTSISQTYRIAKTGKTRVRRADVFTPSYKIARKYMIRLEKEDFSDEEKLRQLAQAASSRQALLFTGTISRPLSISNHRSTRLQLRGTIHANQSSQSTALAASAGSCYAPCLDATRQNSPSSPSTTWPT